MVDFLVIGPFNTIRYKEVFPLIMDKKINLGYKRVSEFCDGIQANTIWFTTFTITRPGFLELTSKYCDRKYEKFDNISAINVDRTEDIPCDYYETMGVPITFLEKWNPEQFDVVGALGNGSYNYGGVWKGSGGLQMTSINGKCKFARILIRKR